MANFYCKHCGQKYSDVKTLTINSCSKSPSKKHELFEGEEQKEYFCLNCGQKYSDLKTMLINSCSKSSQNIINLMKVV
jgi:predicted  nucleic acid-binding Zn-ribbon protein